ncbi:hypothetical protein [Pontibacillus yanchengensis]|uniref:hypothetical protein n=1 Tax=Pontibacillus yanchengensis TaxID=462910 RepID=UPI001371B4A3|nr:hypothetical protein [Pontibacillus yanchengensis]
MIPLYGLLIWTYYYPEEIISFGSEWMYGGGPKISTQAIRYTKFASITIMFGLPIIHKCH